MPKNQVFISYSNVDAGFVEDLASQLKSKGVSLWLDRYEIKPGEYVRDKINSGISDSAYFLVVLSPSSIDSEWVKREIDAAMTLEINEKTVRLIPLLFGNITSQQIPADIRGKNYLDFRKGSLAKRELSRLLSLLLPDLDQYREFLAQLRLGLPEEKNSTAKLRELLCKYHDQRIQKAAARGLVKIGTAEAILALVERMLDTWGCGTLEYCIRALELLEDQGGIMALICTLYWDTRYIEEKLQVLVRAFQEECDFGAFLKSHTTENGTPHLSIVAALLEHTPPAIAAAFRFSSQYWPTDVGFAGSTEPPFWMPKVSFIAREEGRSVIDAKIPGLTALIVEKLTFVGVTEEESRDWLGRDLFRIGDIKLRTL